MCNTVPDHPVIHAMETTGYPDGVEPEFPKCPICGEETDTVYVNKKLEIVGCSECITSRDAWYESECFREEEG